MLKRERERFEVVELNDARPFKCPSAALAKLQSAFFNAFGESVYVCPTFDPDDTERAYFYIAAGAAEERIAEARGWVEGYLVATVPL